MLPFLLVSSVNVESPRCVASNALQLSAMVRIGKIAAAGAGMIKMVVR
jgi:hypothetical protein